MRQHQTPEGLSYCLAENQRASLELQDVFEKARLGTSTNPPHLAAFAVQSLMCDLLGADDG
jgi:hypothetical protein